MRPKNRNEPPEHQEYKPIHSKLKVCSEKFSISIKREYSRPGEDEWKHLSLGLSPMPKSNLLQRMATIKDYPDFFWTIVASVDAYLLRIEKSKSTHLQVALMVRTLIKLAEYAVLNGYYKFKDMPVSEWERLKAALAEGGWGLALNIEQRALNFLSETGTAKAEQFFREPRQRGRQEVLNSELLQLIGSNVSGRELQPIKRALSRIRLINRGCDEDVAMKAVPKLNKRLSAAWLTQTLQYFELLIDIPNQWRLEFSPTSNAYQFGLKHGAQKGKTPNISPEVLALILKNAYQWIVEIGPGVIDGLEDITVRMTALRWDEDLNSKMPRKLIEARRSKLARTWLLESASIRKIAEKTGQRITTYNRKRGDDENETSLNTVVGSLLTACFVVLATMNSRRHDEISGKHTGLHEKSLQLFDAELNLFECEFYVEKSIRDYVSFFINDISATALKLLERVAALAWDWEMFCQSIKPDGKGDALRIRKLFVMPDLLVEKGGSPIWFRFEAPYAQKFLQESLGDLYSFASVTPHMFRRGYGLVYHFRFEHPLLEALAQKYGHFDTTKTLHYVTDFAHHPLGSTAVALWALPSDVVRAARKRHVAELEESVKDVGRDKLVAFVEDVVQGAIRYSGGFAKLVARFSRAYGNSIDYSLLDANGKAKALSMALLKRGHMPLPFPHTTCMAGSNEKLAACSSLDGGLNRHIASPTTCVNCAYAATTATHVMAMERELLRMAQDLALSNDTLQGRRKKIEYLGLKRVIQLHKTRLGALENE